jgi:hypothetical protein
MVVMQSVDYYLSKKSLASLILAARYGDPPLSGWFRSIIRWRDRNQT